MTETEALRLFRKLLLARKAEDRIRAEYPSDAIKTPVHLAVGAEAIAVGVCHCLPDGSKTFGTYRNHALYLAVSNDTAGFFAELYGKVTGPAKGKAGSMHLSAPESGLLATSAVVGTTIPLALGAALALSYRKEPGIVAVFFGDGAVEEGVFWESLNFASLHRLPLLFVCEDNGLAIHTPTVDRQGFRSIPQAIAGFRTHFAGGNGSDVHSVVDTTRQIIEKMSVEPGPGFLHFPYFRFLEHVGPAEDFSAGYRPQPSPDELRRLDPVAVLENQIRQNPTLEGELKSIYAAVEEEIDRAVQAAKQGAFPDPSELYRDVFA